ncbi:MAG: TrmH family RNA methyltransferase [Bacteroidetes bacterium]|nr:MAG: TrmH family RNA methyltransferase [Bacteroidota bacterium]
MTQYNLNEKKQILIFLLTFISENKQRKFKEVIRFRTRHITVVLEDIYQPHNASAVLRSCDCFGIQDVHIIENKNAYEINPDVALGSAKWLNLMKYNETEFNTITCLTRLKDQGYQIVATTPHQDDFTPESFPLENKFALLFGTELLGLTTEALSMANRYIRVPMVGFTESLNISVSAAILLHTLTGRLRSSSINWGLSNEEETDTLIAWASSVVRKPEALIRNFMGNQ